MMQFNSPQTRHARRSGALLACALLTAAASAQVTHIVQVNSLTFSPANITVAPGDTVRWVRVTGTHTVTSGGGCTHDGLYFDAPIDVSNPTFEWVVPSGLTSVPYFCRPHCLMGMTGLITITENYTDYVMTLDGDQEVPPNTSTASGSGTGRYFPATNRFHWTITFADLSSAQTAAHFHGPARPCVNAGVQIGTPNGSPVIGSATLTATQLSQLNAGLWYYNVHTSNFTGGEIRGQVYPAPLDDPIPGSIAVGDKKVRLELVADGLTAPNWGTHAPGHPGRLFVADQDGIIWNINLGSGAKSVFADVSALLVPLGVFGPDSFDERGLLGIAFHPQYQSNGLVYTFTSEPASGTPDFTTLPGGAIPNCHSVISEWHVLNPASADATVDPGSRRVLVKWDKPQFNHNGGGLVFGPDGYLYISVGDGGGADDKDGQPFIGEDMVGHGCIGNGQNLGAILGKILRIDPTGSNSSNGQYGIPADNPFVGVDGLDEIWAGGLRNPWRISFDSATGDLWCADVGQNHVEEINIVTGGANYGWKWKEGSFWFVFNGNSAGYVTDVPLDVPAGLTDPVAEYDHDEGLSIIGGFTYRGAELPGLTGMHVFGDFARTFSNDGRLFYLDAGNVIREFDLYAQGALDLSLLGFGEDAAGEVYVLGNTTGTPFGTTGVVLRLMSGRGDLNCDGLVDFGDINPFVLLLSNPDAWHAQFPDCDMLNGDISGNGTVGFDDINPFVALLSS